MASASTLVARVRTVALAAAVAAGVSVFYFASTTSAQSGTGSVNLMAAKTVTGTVLNIEGKPAAVQVRLLTKGTQGAGPARRGPNDSPTGDSVLGAPEAQKLQKNPGAIQPGEKLVKETTSDAAGKFTFTAVPQGEYVILAGSGRNAARVNIEVKDSAEVAPVTLKLPNK
ncbi:hypothetical protein BH09PLA1_BH09PLA1_17790 [soil metagenome]